MAASPQDGLKLFLSKYCQEPDLVRGALERQGLAERMVWLTDGQLLCKKGDPAECYWIICAGDMRVEDAGVLVATRHLGQIVGEAAFYRPLDSYGNPCRGQTLRALGDVKLLRIDGALIDAFSDPERSRWHETVARVLTEKLDLATNQRVDLHQNRALFQALISRFVCTEGEAAALAALGEPGGGLSRAIAVEASTAVIWFSDITGFSKYALSLPPKEAGAVVRSIMDIQVEEISTAGGQIDKFMGDGLMAFWRAPDSRRLHAASQAAAGAAHRTAMRLVDLFKQKSLPLDIRIGLHAGPVILGDFGGGDRIAFTAIGDAVNSAARYEQAAQLIDGSPLGRVRISPEVFGKISDRVVRAAFDERPALFADKHGTRFEVHLSKTL